MKNGSRLRLIRTRCGTIVIMGGFAVAEAARLADGTARTNISTFGLAAVLAASVTLSGLASAETTAPAPQVCDLAKKHSCEELVQDNILWKIDEPDNSASKHWQQKNLDALCACTPDPYETVNCFQVQVNNHRKTWQEAIATCHAKP
jgi:hypothetical protein